tara:strand:- start:255 stop:740 length:486 start_codon:yes stop_codon:yes gene_type:complete
MTTIAKVLIPNKSWILEDDGLKVGTVIRQRSSYYILKNGQEVPIGNVKDVQEKLGITFNDVAVIQKSVAKEFSVYDYPCNSKPFGAVYNIRKKLPIYAKSNKSKSQYCAGYYVIKFRKGWVKSFSPKLITLDRYPYHGPFKTELEMKSMLATLSRKENETN